VRTLILNSYAGSLTLGARALGAEIIGSYEDSNFGLDIQKANFPELNYISYMKDWPAQDLSETFVIAHPPCSAFSVQNCSPTARGPNSNAFACTKHVLQYAVDNKALGIAIESVMGALGGAWNEHQHYADEYGYNLYRIIENGCMFGCQWRERFWVLYLRKGAAPDVLHLTITPRYQTVKDVVAGHEGGRSAGNLDVLLERQKQRLVEKAGLTPGEMSYFFDPQDPPHPTKALGTILYEKKYKKPDSTSWDKWQVFQDYIGGFASGTMVYLDPNGMAPVLMGGSHWYYNGRNLSENGFKRVMDFPAEYIFPESPRNFKTQLRMYLSKGVMPPIAEWILEQATLHLGWRGQARLSSVESAPKYQLEVEPNHLADFRISKAAWWDRHIALPPLRSEEAPIKEKRSVTLTREPRVKVPRATRGEITVKRSRLSDVRLEFVSTLDNAVTITDRKRSIILAELQMMITPTHHDVIMKCLEHPELQILPTTMHWHVRQLVKGGQLREVIV